MTFSRITAIVTILVCAFAVSACANTIRGAGKDVTSTVDVSS